MVGIVGPDGVGKSTLMALVAGSKKMQDGKVTVLGGDIADVRHRRAVGPRIAYMPQGLGKNLYLELSVYDNVDFMAQLFGLSPAERKRARQGAARRHRARPVRGSPGRQALGRHEAEGRAVRRAGPRSGPAHPRRADHRRRSALAAAVLDAHRRHPRRAPGHERRHLHRLHGRGAAVGLDRRDGRGTRAGDRDAGRADGSGRARKDLEKCFIALLPEEKRTGHKELTIPPRAAAKRRSPSRPTA